MAKIAEDWKKAVTEYYFITGEKKPDDAFDKFFSTSHKDVTKTIDKIVDIQDENQYDGKAKDFSKAFDKFQSTSSQYIKQLEKLIETEKAKTVKTMKDDGEIVKLRTKRLRGLKMLKTRLDDYEATFVVQYNILSAIEQNLSAIERIERGMAIGLKKGFTRALAASAAIKATPTVETWNAEMGHGGDAFRSVTTALGVFKTLNKMYSDKELEVPRVVAQHMANADAWVKRLTPWASGRKYQLEEGADVRAELKDAMQELKACMAEYSDFVA